MSIATVTTRGFGSFGSIAEVVAHGYIAVSGGAAATTTTIHPRSGIRSLTPAMLRNMERRAAKRAASRQRGAEDEAIAAQLAADLKTERETRERIERDNYDAAIMLLLDD